MGWLSDAWDSASDAVTDVVDYVEDAAETVVDTATDVAESAGVPGAGFLGAVIGAAVDLGESVAETTIDLGVSIGERGLESGDAFMNVLDDTVFDSVDLVTFGTVDIDYDDGTFGAHVGIPGVATAGLDVGENGVWIESESLVGSTTIGYDAERGLDLSASAGVNWGPLPYVEGHVKVGQDGEVSIGGEFQGTLPTPYGVFSGSGAAGFDRTADGSWQAHTEGEGSWLLPTGVSLGVGHAVSYAEDADGNTSFHVDAHGSVGYAGTGTVGAGVGYTRVEADGVLVEETTVDGFATGYGMTVEAGAEHTQITTAEGSISHTDGHADIGGLDADSISQLAGTYIGGTAGEVVGAVGGIAVEVAMAAAADGGSTAPAAGEAGADALVGTVQVAASGGSATPAPRVSDGLVDVLGESAVGTWSSASGATSPFDSATAPTTVEDVGVFDAGTEWLDDADVATPASPEFDVAAVSPPADFDLDLAATEATQDSIESVWDGVGDV